VARNGHYRHEAPALCDEPRASRTQIRDGIDLALRPGMTTSRHKISRALVTAVPVCAAWMMCASSASAQERYVRVSADSTARYPVEIEAHAAFGTENVYGNTGFGAGLRVSIPLVAGWLGGNVSDNLAISFGGDILNYQNCYYADRCGANYLMLPVAAQWNVFFGRRFSLFGEAGGFLYRGFFDGCNAGDAGCNAPDNFGILPTFALGARVRLAPNVALLARLGYPTSTLGVSFL
jgi:hypothetical protein